MVEKYIWHKIAWNDYQKWIKENKAIARKIIELIEDILENGVLKGKGKPEKLKYTKKPKYSRRIDQYNRLVYELIYEIDEKTNKLRILSCKGHYDNLEKFDNED